ncbi:SusC/RagA family TonB-linked outer membrane protein [Bacteroidia bacterium]|nr:SusC/RagA family TonB-linked outer membrane protein [Bacteroidia bacterium]
MKKIILMLICFSLTAGAAVAQNRQIQGKVVDEGGEPVIGASVTVKGNASVGTVTDVEGQFKLSVPADAQSLIVKYLGMKDGEAAVADNVSLALQPADNSLEEVVVTGYGNFRKTSFTGAASTVGTRDVKDAPSETVQSRLAGTVAGVKVSANAGQPGGYTSMRIRGSGSISASNNPLYVIDGVPVFTGDISEFSYAASGTDPLSLINPSDIETITVIKDAAAASLYGSRAANGVILITTKKGTSGKPVISFKADWGNSDIALNGWRKTLDGDTRREILKLGYENYGMTSTEAEAELLKSKYANKPATGWQNWKDLVLRTAAHSNQEFNVRGGDKNTQYFASLGHTDQEGISKQSEFERYTGRVNITHQSDRLTLDGSALISKTRLLRSNEATSFASPIMAAFGMAASPAFDPYNPDGTFNYGNSPASATSNALASMVYNYNDADLFRSTSSLKAGYRLWDNLVLSERLSYDHLQDNEIVWWDSRTGDGKGYNGLRQTIIAQYQTLASQTQLAYKTTIAQLHEIDALAAFESEDTHYTYAYMRGYDFPQVDLRELANAAETSSETSSETTRLLSYLGRVNYTYDDKYYLSASFRRDGTSRLSTNTRWGNFGSISGAWRISNENFFTPIKEVLTDAKIRVSYGTNGNLPSGWYAYQGVYDFTAKYNGLIGSNETTIQNNKLNWETNAVTNIGFDIQFIDRIGVTLDFYNRDTEDLLYEVPISQTTGFSTAWSNIALINNKGIEVEIKSENIRKNDFTWNSSLNLAYNKNEVKKISDSDEPVITGNGGQTIMEKGKPLYGLYAYEYAGVDPATGKESYYINREGHEREITTDKSKADKTNLGSATPEVSGGITNSLRYKGIDFSFVFTYSLGGQVYDNAYWQQSNGGTYNYNSQLPAYYKVEDMWKKPGDNAKLPQFVYGQTYTPSSRWIYSTDHLRLKNVTLGYSVPSKVLKKAGIGKVRAYASAVNLLTFTKKGLYLDPETTIDGFVVFQTPPMKTVTFGLELEF